MGCGYLAIATSTRPLVYLSRIDKLGGVFVPKRVNNGVSSVSTARAGLIRQPAILITGGVPSLMLDQGVLVIAC